MKKPQCLMEPVGLGWGSEELGDLGSSPALSDLEKVTPLLWP